MTEVAKTDTKAKKTTAGGEPAPQAQQAGALYLQHRKHPNYQVVPATGAVVLPAMSDRIELSFYVERAEVVREQMERTPQGLKAMGNMETELFREHVVGLSLSGTMAKELYVMLGKIVGQA